MKGQAIPTITFAVLLALTGCRPQPVLTPTAIPTRTPTAIVSNLPPRLLSHVPARGAEHRPDAPITLRFDQAMDMAATTAAFRLEPQAEGRIGWPDPLTLVFTPTTPLSPGIRYRVAVAESARGAAGLMLAKPVAFHFTTSTPLSVTQVNPPPGATEVLPSSDIRVTFNRPVVPLTVDALRDQSRLPHPLNFEPPVSGQGEWIDPTVYIFRPESLKAATTYRVRVRAGLTDITGMVLAQDYEWAFTTLAPAVLETYPVNQAINVPPDAVLRITFNQPMAQRPVQFILRDQNGSPVPGQADWAEATTLIFTPMSFLTREMTFNASLGPVQNAAGNMSAPAYSWTFSTLPHFRFVGSSPPVGGGIDVSELADLDYPGQLFLEFSAPFSLEDFSKHLTISPTQSITPHIWHSRYTNDQVGIDFLQPSTVYTLTIDGALTDQYGEALGQDVILHFQTLPLPPIVYLNTDHDVGVLWADEPPVVYAAYRSVSQLNFTLRYRGPDDVRNCARQRRPPSPCYPDALSPLPPSRTWSAAVSPISVTTVIPVALADGPLPLGLYHLTVSEPSADQEYGRRCLIAGYRHPICFPPRSQTIVVANGHILLRKGLHQTFAWATDRRTGEPLAGRTILVPLNEELYTAVTDADGTAILPAETGWAFIVEGDIFAVGYTGWTVRTWSWGRGWYEEPCPNNGFYGADAPAIYLYTDRPLYRPGDTVYFKGIFRMEDGQGRYRLSFPPTLTVTIESSLGEEVYNRALRLIALGTFSDALPLESYAPLGEYRVMVNHEWRCYSVPFRVAAYRSPEFEVTLATDKEAYFPGEVATVQVEARYYFGAPVHNAAVEWEWRDPQSNVLEKGNGLTDADGRFLLSRAPGQPGTFRLLVRVRDAAGQTVGGQADVQVRGSAMRLEVVPAARFLAAGQTLRAAVRAADLDDSPRAGEFITLTVYRQTSVGEMRVFTAHITTDVEGWAGASFTLPSGGRYRLAASATDQAGRPGGAEATVWVVGPDASWPTDQVLIVTDRSAYAPGDTAQVLISNPWPGSAQALLTIERGDVLEHRALTVPPGGVIVEWPIQPHHAPNIFFAASLIPTPGAGRPAPAALFGVQEAAVSLVERTLQLELDADPPEAQPGQTVTWTVRATDWQGKPARAELSLALVDKAVLSLAGANAPDPFSALYSKRAQDVSVAAGLRCPASQATLLSVRYYYWEDAGIGGGGDGEAWGETQVRQRFQGTALWVPVIHTDDTGLARVQVALPDNVTTWQMDVRAVDADTRVGHATAELVASKPFLVRPVTPRFLVVGDRVELGAVVHNDTAVPLTATVTLSATGVTLNTPPTQTLLVPAQGEAVVLWNAVAQMSTAADLVFSAVAYHPDVGRLADASRPPVGLPPDQHLPVYHYTTPETIGTAGQLPEAGELVEGLLLPPDLGLTQGELTVRLDYSLAGAVVNTLKARDYTYRTFPTAEQVASRLLPNLFAYRAIREGGLDAPQVEAALVPLIREDLFYVRLLQHDDGGWGWLRTDPSSPIVSAQLLLALVHAQRLGFTVEQQRIDRAVDYLQGQVRPPDTVDSLNHQAIILHALAEAGAGDEAALAAVAAKRQRLQYYARALLLLAFARVNPRHPAVSPLVSDLHSAAISTATGAHWEEEGQPDYWAMNTDHRTTAIVLDALVHMSPDSEIVPNAVRWLMVARKADGTWETTQETTWSLIALTDWLMASGELRPDYAWQVALNGRRLAQGQATRQNVLETQVLRVVVADLLQDTANRLSVSRDKGPGRLYYTAHLRVFRPVEAVPPISRGIFVAREYTSLADPTRPITSARVGEVVQARLTIVALHDLHYVVVEDPFPAGCEPVDPALRNAANPWRTSPRDYHVHDEGGTWWLNHVELRDEKVVVRATHLPRGTYKIHYMIQATRPGQYYVLPPSASETFFPEVFGHGAGSVFIVQSAE